MFFLADFVPSSLRQYGTHPDISSGAACTYALGTASITVASNASAIFDFDFIVIFSIRTNARDSNALLYKTMFGLTSDELSVLSKLTTPQAIQDFLDTLPINHEKDGETCYSPRLVLRHKKAHCLEGALLASLALKLHGEKPLIMNFKTMRGDEDHAVTLFKRSGYYGAISKTNHAVLRWRDPIYRTVRELALSYYHEYFLFESGKKTLLGYSTPMNVFRFGTKWPSSEHSLWHIADALADSPHSPFVPEGNKRFIRPATPFERLVVEPVEWKEEDPRT